MASGSLPLMLVRMALKSFSPGVMASKATTSARPCRFSRVSSASSRAKAELSWMSATFLAPHWFTM